MGSTLRGTELLSVVACQDQIIARCPSRQNVTEKPRLSVIVKNDGHQLTAWVRLSLVPQQYCPTTSGPPVYEISDCHKRQRLTGAASPHLRRVTESTNAGMVSAGRQAAQAGVVVTAVQFAFMLVVGAQKILIVLLCYYVLPEPQRYQQSGLWRRASHYSATTAGRIPE